MHNRKDPSVYGEPRMIHTFMAWWSMDLLSMKILTSYWLMNNIWSFGHVHLLSDPRGSTERGRFNHSRSGTGVWGFCTRWHCARWSSSALQPCWWCHSSITLIHPVLVFRGQESDILAHCFYLRAWRVQHLPDVFVLLLFGGHLALDLLKLEADHPDHLS